MKRSIIFFAILLFFASMFSSELKAQSWTYNATASGSDYYMNFSYKSDVVCDCNRKYTVSAYRVNYSPSNFLGSESGSSRDGSFRAGIGPSVTQSYNMSLIGTGKNDFVFDCATDCEFSGSGTLRRSTSSIKRPTSASASDGGTTIKVEWLVNSYSDHELLVRFAGYDKSRVKKVQLQYAPLGTFAWETGAEWTADELLDIAEGTTALWNVVNLYDGHYQLRLRADYGDGDVYSLKTNGLIDRRGPEVFGLPEPADGDLAPDEVVSVQFDEEIDCFSANAQQVRFESLTTGSLYPVQLGCSGGKLIIRPLWNANAHQDEIIRVTVDGLNDQYQNKQASPVTWTFRIIDGDSPSFLDTDQDGISDLIDNCPLSANSDQSDLDNDGIGDTCDDDADGDGILNQEDNCPYFSNPSQTDIDGNGIGDECEPTADGDGDGVPNAEDNCLYHSNPDQTDQDGDGIGDACDDDVDGDGLLNFADNCRYVPNPDQTDANGDGYGDVCENTVPTDEAFGTLASVRLMPNPANNQVTIEWNLEEPGDWQWQLLTLSGQVLRQMGRKPLSAGRHQAEVTVSDLPNGLYLLRFFTDDGMSTRKLMVLH